MSLRRFPFGTPQPARPRSRLTESEALDIARGVLGAEAAVNVTAVTETPTGVEWQIHTLAFGSGDVLRIADATGQVIERGRWGVR